MKKLFLIILFGLFCFSKGTLAQIGISDTLTYLKSIEANKSQYIGQPFSILLNTLQLDIKFFQPFATKPHDRFKETTTIFSFYFPNSNAEMYLASPSLTIIWETPLDINQSFQIFGIGNNKGRWNTAALSYYSSSIIKNIVIIE